MLFQSTIISIIIQALTGLIDVWGLTKIKVHEDDRIFRDLLQVELGVQAVEFFFYIWLIANFSKINNITPYRYADWFITTPIMLITLMAYLNYKTTETHGLVDFLQNHKNSVVLVVVLNILMLVFGFLGETNHMNLTTSSILGFIPFVIYFWYIYEEFITKHKIEPVDRQTKEETIHKKKVYWYFVFFWGLYGVASFLDYVPKNTMFNILDLFAKNFFGVFLVYILWTRRI